MPEIANLEKFLGTKLHSSEYRSREDFYGKRVIVVGHGLSGVEIAADVAGCAKSVTHLFRRPSWIIPRYIFDAKANREIPLDLVFYRHKAENADTADNSKTEPKTPYQINQARNRYLAGISKQNKINENTLKIDPDCGGFYPIAISDRYLECIRGGSITPVKHASISDVFDNSIRVDDSQDIAADVIIFATGYRSQLPFLDQVTKDKFEYQEHDPLMPTLLFNHTLTQNIPGLGFVGFYKGPFWGTLDLQARLIALQFAGKLNEISSAEYESDRNKKLQIRSLSPRPQFPDDYVTMCDRLAAIIGCDAKLPSTDDLHHYVKTGPVVPAHYRLTGPHTDREHAERVITDLNTTYFPGTRNG